MGDSEYKRKVRVLSPNDVRLEKACIYTNTPPTKLANDIICLYMDFAVIEASIGSCCKLINGFLGSVIEVCVTVNPKRPIN